MFTCHLFTSIFISNYVCVCVCVFPTCNGSYCALHKIGLTYCNCMEINMLYWIIIILGIHMVLHHDKLQIHPCEA
jgi:hypothetical protein